MPPIKGGEGSLSSKCLHSDFHSNSGHVCLVISLHPTPPLSPPITSRTLPMVMPTILQNKAGEHLLGSAPFANRSDLAACSLVPRAIKMDSPLDTGVACVHLEGQQIRYCSLKTQPSLEPEDKDKAKDVSSLVIILSHRQPNPKNLKSLKSRVHCSCFYKAYS